MRFQTPTNQDIGKVLDQIADLLEAQKADPHRIRAYRFGARSIRRQAEPVARLVQEGDGKALEDIPGIGRSLARLIEEVVRTGKSQLLHRLQGEVTPEDLFEQVPGIGHELAERIVRELEIKTLEELEQAAHDGRLATVEGFGRRRLELVQMSLAGMLSGFARRRVMRMASEKEEPESPRPEVAILLEVDEEYRTKAKAGELRKIAPRRFNPDGEAWLPIYHVEKEDWSFTALFSNTARAHELGKTDDWVVIFYEKDGKEGQATVVTETRGPLQGMRVVRGREQECLAFLEFWKSLV